MIDDVTFREKYAPNDLIVVMACTGDEFPFTTEQVSYAAKRCKQADIEFVHITPDMGFHSDSWLSLRHFYNLKGTCGSKAFPKTCSDRLKIQPIYRFLEHYLGKKYGVRVGRKTGFKEFAARYGKIDMIVGISKGEETRTTDASDSTQAWMRSSIEMKYPLIDLQWDREACQTYLHSKTYLFKESELDGVKYTHKQGHPLHIAPSNCILCPWANLAEIEYLRRFFPVDLQDWIRIEAVKIKKNQHMDSVEVIVTDKKTKLESTKIMNKNLGVFGLKKLPEIIAEAQEKYKDWTDKMIEDYRYSHGHCVKSKF